ncbi:hypothetical protein H0A66_02785 [Alcaligenaceae bacterium]|nr:hypothetical protein [Alcaligenaceae bacterium]
MHKKILIPLFCIAAFLGSSFGLVYAKPTGALQTSSGVFTFVPKLCGIHKEGDFYDIEVHGAGVAPGGEKVYVEFSSTADALDVNFGVDSMLASSDTTLQSEGQLQIRVDGKKIRAIEIKLVDQDRRVVDANATLEIDCSLT